VQIRSVSVTRLSERSHRILAQHLRDELKRSVMPKLLALVSDEALPMRNMNSATPFAVSKAPNPSSRNPSPTLWLWDLYSLFPE
jgi:hypothetical protein